MKRTYGHDEGSASKPYQGSKRHLARYILPFFPSNISRLVEPFAGSAAISVAAAIYRKATFFHLNDINEPLMALRNEIINNPADIANRYEKLWQEQQQTDVRQYYDIVRDEFNRTRRAEHLLYLLARRVKASVRYNAEGAFNQSPDNRRLGRRPERMRKDIFAVSALFRNKTLLTCMDYKQVLTQVSPFISPHRIKACVRRAILAMSTVSILRSLSASCAN